MSEGKHTAALIVMSQGRGLGPGSALSAPISTAADGRSAATKYDTRSVMECTLQIPLHLGRGHVTAPRDKYTLQHGIDHFLQKISQPIPALDGDGRGRRYKVLDMIPGPPKHL